MTTNRIAVAVLTLAGLVAASESASAQTIISPGVTTGGYYTTPGTYYYGTPQYTYPSTGYYSPGITTTSYYTSPSTTYYYPSTSYYPYTSSYYSPYSGYNSYYNGMYNYGYGYGRGGRRR